MGRSEWLTRRVPGYSGGTASAFDRLPASCAEALLAVPRPVRNSFRMPSVNLLQPDLDAKRLRIVFRKVVAQHDDFRLVIRAGDARPRIFEALARSMSEFSPR
jgi:hypothetical protein